MRIDGRHPATPTQQSAAAVEERILANCAALVSGRLEASESMPLPLRFPFPAWVTRAEEATAP